MDKATARAAVTALQSRLPNRFTTGYADRARQLIDDPGEMNQGYYGTCGPAAAVRALLLYDRAKFVDLVESVFDPQRPVFNGIRVAPDKLLAQRQTEIARKSGMYPPPPDPSAYDHHYDLDFILAGSLYTYLEQAGSVVYERQRDYSESIVRLVGVPGDELVLTTFGTDLGPALNAGLTTDPGLIRSFEIHGDLIARRLGYRLDGLKINNIERLGAYAWEIGLITSRGDRKFVIEETPTGFRLIVLVPGESQGIGFATGDLALDHEGITTLMRRVVGVASAQLVTRRDSSAEKKVQQALTQPNAYVIGLVKGYAEWNRAHADASARTFTAPAAPPARIDDRPAPHIEHHLMVHGITRSEPDDVVDVWSWATSYTVRMRAMHTGSYFHGYLVGQVI